MSELGQILAIAVCSGAVVCAVLKVNAKLARMTDGTRR